MATPPIPAVTGEADSARLLRQRESLREVIESISSELELRPLLTRIVRHACELLDAAHGIIGLYDDDHNVIRTEAQYGIEANELGEEMMPGVGLAGQVLRVRRPVVLERYDQLPVMVRPELASDAVLGVPILWRERLIGFFGVGAPPPRRFDAPDVESLALLARHAAIAIENARQYQLEAARTERLRLVARVGRIIAAGLDLDTLLDNAGHVIHELLGYPNIAIALADPRDPDWLSVRGIGGYYTKLLSGEHRQHVSQGIVGVAARERTVQLVNDVASDARYLPTQGAAGIRAELAVPIVLSHHLLGVLNIESASRFTEEDAASLQIVADHLAVAIQNVRLYEQAGRLAVLEERQRIARELHDSITQMIFTASLLSQSIAPAWRRSPDEGERISERIVELSRTALAEMRALLHELRPVADEHPTTGDDLVLPARFRLQRDGLELLLRQDAQRLSGDSLTISVEVEGGRRLGLEHEEALYRIFQEALHNALKHATAHHVLVRFACAPGEARLAVTDDGAGFAPGDGRRGDATGFGLRNMRERAAALGGTLDLRSAPSRGTTVEVVLPIEGE